MDQTASILNAEKRDLKGKGPARRLRARGLIPAVVYSRRTEPTHLAIDPTAIQKAIATPHRFNTLLTLKLDGVEKRVLFRDYEVDPVTRNLLHADFLEVNLDETVKVEVPVVTTGRSEGVAAGGILSLAAHEIVLEALPNKIPAQIEVDISGLKIGGSIHIADVKAPEGCKLKFATNYVVAFVAVPEKEEVVVPVAAAVPGATPAEGAAGAAPAAGAAGATTAPAAGDKKGGEAKGGKK